MKRITALIIVTALTLPACSGSSAPQPAETQTQASTAVTPVTAEPVALSYSAPFADYEDYVYSGTPQIPDYTISGGLANVDNLLQFTENEDWASTYGYWHSENNLSEEAIKLIEQNGFAVSDKYSYDEFFQVYEANRYNHVPNFITSDSAVHTFHLMFDYVLKDLEQSKLHGILTQLSKGMAEASYAQYKELASTSFANAALRNTAFFSVGSRLLDGSYSVPAEAAEAVSRELALIEAKDGIGLSPVINLGADINDPDAYKTDYTQYITRSHYNQTEELQAFFKAMMWYGQTTFRSSHEDEVKSALLQASALADDGLSALWANIFEPTNFFVGECDDITYYQYTKALDGVYGAELGQTSKAADDALFAEAFEIIKKMEPPKINSIPIWDTEDKGNAITGYRFMGQRFTLDAYVFHNLIDRAVEDRMLPDSLDIPAAFGSEAALELLAEDTAAYPGYTERMTELRAEIAQIPQSEWTKNLYWSWMYMLLPYTDGTDGAGYPLFMQSPAWTLKELNSFQGSWTELKHDTLLYAKAAMAEMGAGEAPETPDDRGYVEPSPVVYGRLAALVKQTRTGLETRGILSAEAGEALDVLYNLSVRLTEVAEKELAGEALSDDDYEFIRTFGGELEHIWDTAKRYELSQVADEFTGEVAGDEMADAMTDYYLQQHPCGVIADVATDPNGLALDEATGYAKVIFVVFPRDGKLVLGSGAVFSQYEFTVPMSERVTDEQWHERMRRNEMPELAGWKQGFTSDIGQTRYDY